MPYQRCDINCNTVTNPASDTVYQDVSCLDYIVWNGDYQRCDKDCNPVANPDILNGWNEDYERTDVNNLNNEKVAEEQVTQVLFSKRDILNVELGYTCYSEGSLYPSGLVDVDVNNVFISRENGEAYTFINDAGEIILLALEPSTQVNPIYIREEDGDILYFVDELGNTVYLGLEE